MSWKEALLGEVCEVQRGTMITQALARPGPIPVVAGGTAPTYFHDESNRPSGTITVSASGANAGFVNYWNQPIFASDCSTVTAPGDAIDIRFIYHQLRSKQHLINGLRSGAAQPHVYAKDIAKLTVKVPPISEQRRIASILDKADDLRAKRRETLAHLDRLTQSIFAEMFGPNHAQYWPVKTVADIVAREGSGIRTGPFGSQLLHSEFVGSGIAVLGIDNAVANEFRWGERRYITEAKYSELRRYTVKPGDVLITIMGTCGRCAVVPNDIPIAINTKHLCCITLDKKLCVPEFLHSYFLRHRIAREYLERTAKGAIMSGLNMGLIKAMPIPLPPLSLQTKFVTRLKTIDAVKAKQWRSLSEIDGLFASLQHRAFQGEL